MVGKGCITNAQGRWARFANLPTAGKRAPGDTRRNKELWFM